MSVGGFPGRFGAFIPVADSASLATMSVNGLTPGTLAWNADVGRFFKLTVPSSAALVTDEVVEVYRTAGARWLAVNPEIPAADLAKLATVPTGSGLVLRARSALIDMGTVATTAWGADWPIAAGYLFVPMVAKFLISAISGTAVASPALTAGTNAGGSPAYGNLIPNSPMAAAVLNGAGVAKNTTIALSASLNTQVPLPEATVSPTVSVTVAATGGTVLTGYVVVIGTMTAIVP